MENRCCPDCGAPAKGIKCEFCGAQIAQSTPQNVAPQAAAQQHAQVPQVDVSPKDWITALLLSIFLGYLGVDRFYVGKIGTGILKLLISICSLGTLAWIWWMIDIVFIATDKFTDDSGKVLKQT